MANLMGNGCWVLAVEGQCGFRWHVGRHPHSTPTSCVIKQIVYKMHVKAVAIFVGIVGHVQVCHAIDFTARRYTNTVSPASSIVGLAVNVTVAHLGDIFLWLAQTRLPW